eukprot:2859201-Pleurochrysis_carterae.AAC.1
MVRCAYQPGVSVAHTLSYSSAGGFLGRSGPPDANSGKGMHLNSRQIWVRSARHVSQLSSSLRNLHGSTDSNNCVRTCAA